MVQFCRIIPVSLFKKETKVHLSILEEANNPLLLTLHGHGAFVVQHLNSYMHIAELADMACHQAALDSALANIE